MSPSASHTGRYTRRLLLRGGGRSSVKSARVYYPGERCENRGREHSTNPQNTGPPTWARVFFADPHSPWQRPTNENPSGLLRQYFPKGTDLSRWSAEALEAVAYALNNRPRKTLGWRTPAEVFEEQLRSLQQAGVAST